ncbi:uncharacterized protein LOC143041552 isoform X2 [Oratosquilla oratoria]|uniref:uncharacterized protein LOC143041552 isoform X2 n=1 Tax=Oratosquilla oratoria TaxID=337810 RepID=UPI003F7780E6
MVMATRAEDSLPEHLQNMSVRSPQASPSFSSLMCSGKTNKYKSYLLSQHKGETNTEKEKVHPFENRRNVVDMRKMPALESLNPSADEDTDDLLMCNKLSQPRPYIAQHPKKKAWLAHVAEKEGRREQEEREETESNSDRSSLPSVFTLPESPVSPLDREWATTDKLHNSGSLPSSRYRGKEPRSPGSPYSPIQSLNSSPPSPRNSDLHLSCIPNSPHFSSIYTCSSRLGSPQTHATKEDPLLERGLRSMSSEPEARVPGYDQQQQYLKSVIESSITSPLPELHCLPVAPSIPPPPLQPLTVNSNQVSHAFRTPHIIAGGGRTMSADILPYGGVSGPNRDSLGTPSDSYIPNMDLLQHDKPLQWSMSSGGPPVSSRASMVGIAGNAGGGRGGVGGSAGGGGGIGGCSMEEKGAQLSYQCKPVIEWESQDVANFFFGAMKLFNMDFSFLNWVEVTKSDGANLMNKTAADFCNYVDSSYAERCYEHFTSFLDRERHLSQVRPDDPYGSSGHNGHYHMKQQQQQHHQQQQHYHHPDYPYKYSSMGHHPSMPGGSHLQELHPISPTPLMGSPSSSSSSVSIKYETSARNETHFHLVDPRVNTITTAPTTPTRVADHQIHPHHHLNHHHLHPHHQDRSAGGGSGDVGGGGGHASVYQPPHAPLPYGHGGDHMHSTMHHTPYPAMSTGSNDDVSDPDSSEEEEEVQVEPPKKRGPGRPPKPENLKKKKEKKTGRLWEFILRLLHDPNTCPSLIRWENHDEGVFRFVQSEKVAEMWGMRKHNTKMNYEKLSRAMRYYYKGAIFEPVLGRRLVYKWGKNAKNWRHPNPNFQNP